MIINSVNIQHVDPIESSNMKISSIKKTNLTESELSKKSLDVGDADLKLPNVFQSQNRHTDVSAEDLSERWFISLKTAQKTLKKTT